MSRKHLVFCLFSISILFTVTVFNAHAAPYYKGKTITVIVGFASGGTDTACRIYMRHLSQYIPGNPTIIVKNMPGGASLKAQNYVFEKAKPDGLTFSFNPWQVMGQLVSAPGVRFRYEDFSFVGGSRAPPFVFVARTDTVPGGLNSVTDLMKAKNLKYAGRNAAHDIDVTNLAGADLFGLKYKYVPGYRGGNAIAASLLSGETNITGTGLLLYRINLEPNLVSKGILKGLWYHPKPDKSGNLAKSSFIPELPTLPEVYKEVFGKEPSGLKWGTYRLALELLGTMNFAFQGPPGIDKEILETLRKAFKAAAEDEATIAEQKKILNFRFLYVPPEPWKTTLVKLNNVDPELKGIWKDRILKKK